MKSLVIAWLASAGAFSAAFVTFMIVWARIDHGSFFPWRGVPRLALVTVGAALVFQFVYGGLVYLVLCRLGWWNLWTVTLAYLLPLVWVGWFAIDTEREAYGMIAWFFFALLVANVTWSLAPGR